MTAYKKKSKEGNRNDENEVDLRKYSVIGHVRGIEALFASFIKKRHGKCLYG
jgi:hypothetical protein